MRAERMIATLLLMQARGRVTAAELADELEISVATARRDLEALSMAGVPVYPQAGRGGGWSLVGGARTDLTGLTAAEAQSLFTLIGSAGSAEATSAVRKLLRALPETFRPDAERAAASVHLEMPRWGEESVPLPDSVAPIQQAIIDRIKITIDYRSRSGPASPRTVSPLGLVAKGQLWYLIAAAEAAVATDDESMIRSYRADRIDSVMITDQPAQRPSGFDLSLAWQEIADGIEARRSLVRARVRVPRRALWVLRDQFGRYLEVIDGTAEHEVVIMVAAHLARSIAEQLAGWGSTVTVLEPDSVRTELAQIGAELVATYRHPSVPPRDGD